MNDLAEKALHGLDVARREIAARPVASLATGGFLAACVVVVTGARIGAAPAAVPIDRWFGLLPAAGYRITGAAMGVAMLAGMVALIGMWLLTVRISHARRFGERQVWTIATVWATPFVLGPPLLSTDIFGYVAHGLLARQGLSPYHHGPIALGNIRVVSAIDPSWRGARSTDGPLASFGEHLAVSVTSGRVLPTVVLLRIIAVLSVVVIGRLAANLAGPRRASALCLTILNPAVLIFVVSAGHVAGVLAAVLLATLVAATHRHWVLAVVLACIAAGLKPVAVLIVPFVIAAHAIARGHWRTAVRDVAVVAVALTLIVFAVPFGLGWINNLSSAAHERTPFAPSSLIADIIGLVVQSASFDDLATGGRIAAGAAGVAVIAYLLTTIRTRPLEWTIGFVVLAAGILSPLVYPPFLVWGVVCLAPTATGARRDWVIALSGVACLLTPVGLGELGGHYATVAAVGLIAAVLLPRLLVRRHNALVTGSQLSAGG